MPLGSQSHAESIAIAFDADCNCAFVDNSYLKLRVA